MSLLVRFVSGLQNEVHNRECACVTLTYYPSLDNMGITTRG